MKTCQVKRIVKENDTLWAQIIKLRDNGRCILCGQKHDLQAHHAFKTKGASFVLRYDSRNGVTLCRGCHFQAHKNQNLEFIQRYMAAVQGIIPIAIQDDLIAKSQEKVRKNLDYLTQISEALKAELKVLSENRIMVDEFIESF